jgi:hypothetical protein
MSDNLQEQSRDTAEVTRRLSDLNIDLIKEGRATVRATCDRVRKTHETIRRSYKMLSGSDWRPPSQEQYAKTVSS